MISQQIVLFISIVGALVGAAAILRAQTLKAAIDSLERLVSSYKEELALTKSKNIEQGATIEQQTRQITILTNTVNSSELIIALDRHLSAHHTEAMTKFDREHDDMVGTNERLDRLVEAFVALKETVTK